MTTQPRVSFVVPAHNEAALLGQTLAAIHAAATGVDCSYELIVVNDASTDDTAEIARSAGARVVDVNLRHIAAVRNAGASEAQGDTLVFVDADTLIDDTVLRAALAALDNGSVGGGATVHMPGRIGWAGVFGLWLWRLLSRIFGWAAGCFVFARRSAFAEAGGFDENYFAGEELYLSRALGRLGRFVVLNERVTTSPRKVERYSGVILVARMLYLGIRGPRAWQRREGLEMWYGDQR